MTPPPWRPSRSVTRRRSGAGARRAFGRTWWGRAWVDALEQRGRLDPNRLPRGRTYARSGRVGELAVRPGEVRAAVQGSRVTPYVVHVRVRTFDAGEWERLLDAVAAKAAHTAALLDGELPPEVVADGDAIGVSLLPEAGEVGPRCSCPDWADPCKHSAAVVYLVADVLDADPFALLLLRGRTRDEVLAALRARRSGPGGRPSSPEVCPGLRVDPGVEARVAYAAARARLPAAIAGGPDGGPAEAAAVAGGQDGGAGADGSVAGAGADGSVAGAGAGGHGGGAGQRHLPSVPLAPRRPGEPAPLAVDPPAWSGLRRQDLADLAADAARRAWALCVGEGDGGLGLDPDLDVVRRASHLLGPSSRSRLADLAARTGNRPRDLGRQAAAWAQGGADALDVVERTWFPAAGALDEARAALAPVGDVRAWRNRATVRAAGLQLRLGRSGSWYRFEAAGDGWELTAGPEPEPDRLVATVAPSRPPAS